MLRTTLVACLCAPAATTFVRPGRTLAPSRAARSTSVRLGEFMEEAGNLPTEEEQARCSELIDTLFSDRKASLGHSPPPFAPFSSLTSAPPPPSQPEDTLRRDPLTLTLTLTLT